MWLGHISCGGWRETPPASRTEGGQRLPSPRHQLFMYFLLFLPKKKEKSLSSEAGRAGTQSVSSRTGSAWLQGGVPGDRDVSILCGGTLSPPGWDLGEMEETKLPLCCPLMSKGRRVPGVALLSSPAERRGSQKKAP